jgi:hypothetical protein
VIEILDRIIEAFDKDPADTEFQEGHLQAILDLKSDLGKPPLTLEAMIKRRMN